MLLKTVTPCFNNVIMVAVKPGAAPGKAAAITGASETAARRD